MSQENVEIVNRAVAAWNRQFTSVEVLGFLQAEVQTALEAAGLSE